MPLDPKAAAELAALAGDALANEATIAASTAAIKSANVALNDGITERARLVDIASKAAGTEPVFVIRKGSDSGLLLEAGTVRVIANVLVV